MSFHNPTRCFSVRHICRSVLLLLAVGGLSACMSAPGPHISGDGHCDDSQLQWSIGQVGDEANMRRLSHESGAGLVNPIGPKTIVTRDLRQDRLRVYLDADNIITAARCE